MRKEYGWFAQDTPEHLYGMMQDLENSVDYPNFKVIGIVHNDNWSKYEVFYTVEYPV